METPMDNCNHCQQDYALSKENARLQLFIRTPECNYIQANCPHCDGWSRIFISIETTCAMLEVLGLYIYPDAPADIQASRRKVFGEPECEVTEAVEVLTELPDLPPQLRRELYDWLRSSDYGLE